MSTAILSVPPEVKLLICDHLPAADIQKLRRVCKTTKHFVDHNGKTIQCRIQRRELGRINSFVSKHVTGEDEPTLLEKIDRWTQIRGIWTDYLSQASSAAMLARHLETHPWPTIPYRRAIRFLVVINILFGCYQQRHWAKDADMVAKLVSALARYSSHFGMPVERHDREAMYLEIMSLRRPRFRARIRSKDEKLEKDYPEHVVTHLSISCWQVGEIREFGEAMIGEYSSAELEAVLGVPALRTEIFAYCVNKASTFSLLRNAIQGKNEGHEVDPMIKAAILEDIYIY